MQKFVATTAALACSLGLTLAAHATQLSVALDIQGQGLTLVDGGVGLEGIGSGSVNLSVNIGGPVQGALLYWAGRDRPCPESGGTCVIPFQPYKDQMLRFDGTLITGTIIGTESQPVTADGPVNNIGFLADVTSIVQAKGAGTQIFSVADGDTASNLFRLNGAGLLVIYTDPANTAQYRTIVFDGLDYALAVDPTPGPTRETIPVAFNHGATAFARQGTLRIFTGDASPARPDQIDISNNTSIINGLDSSDGVSWDTDALVVDIPAAVGSTTTQVISGPVGADPDSLLWQVAALRVPLEEEAPVETACGQGYWKNHTDAWPPTGFSPAQTVGSVFSGAGSLGSRTLLQALSFKGGPGANGARQILLRSAVAALLNAAHPTIDYPRTTAEVIADVNAALASNDRATMLLLATELDNDNNLGCPLD